MDYKCEESLKTKYCAKLTAAGFVDEDGYGIYKKTTTEYKLAAIISYGGGTLALSLSAEHRERETHSIALEACDKKSD